MIMMHFNDAQLPEGNSLFCGLETADVSRGEA